MIRRENLKILSNEEISKDHYRITLLSRSIAKAAKPGQFVQISVSDGLTPFFSRPFSILDVSTESVSLLYRVVGEGTSQLSRKKRNESITAIGPLGNGFSLERALRSKTILVGGGVGIPPLYFFAKYLITSKASKIRRESVAVIIGGRDKNQLQLIKEFKRLGVSLHLATDDGSEGYKGLVTDLLEDLLSCEEGGTYSIDRDSAPAIYACGPKPMLKTTALLADKFCLECEVSLEEVMACGFGACLGCAVKTDKGFAMSCQEGPVFDSKEIIWD